MYEIRPFRNSDLAGLVSVWNRWMTGPNVAVPITTGEYDQFVLSRPYFEASSLLVAVDLQSNAIQGFAHCGFGPEEPAKYCMSLNRELGTIALVCSPPDRDLTYALVKAGVDCLKMAGAKVVYAGGRYPLNPFYWGLYGGSEFSGVLETQPMVIQVLAEQSFQECGQTVLLEFDLARPAPRHVKNAILRRDCRVELEDETKFKCRWTELALETFLPMTVDVTDKQKGKEIASASLWPMSLYGRRTGQSRIGLIDVHVHPDCRRKGYGRLLLSEAIKSAAELSYDVLCVQTDAANTAAIDFYENSGFVRAGSARLFRLSVG